MAVVHHVRRHEDELRHLVGCEVSLEVVERADGPEASPVVGNTVIGNEGARGRQVSPSGYPNDRKDALPRGFEELTCAS